MDLIPVLDLMHGQVVRAMAGRREEYAPNRSLLADSADPREVCEAFRLQFSPNWFYVADLNGILSGGPQFDLIEELLHEETSLAVDAGVASVTRARKFLDLGVDRVIVGLETLPDFSLLKEFLSECGPDRLAFSLDLKEGMPLRRWPGLGTPERIIAEAVDIGVRNLVVLDLASIGIDQGVTTFKLCEWIKHRCPTCHVWTGGGVRSIEDLQELASVHVDGALVASALHDGRISPEDWQDFEAADRAIISIWTDE